MSRSRYTLKSGKVSHPVSHLTTAITFTAALLVGVAVVTSQSYDEPSPAAPHAAPMPSDYLPSQSALDTELRLEGRGFRCTEASQLTDTVIVDVNQRARVVALDRAFQLAEQGAWIRAYCLEETK